MGPFGVTGFAVVPYAALVAEEQPSDTPNPVIRSRSAVNEQRLEPGRTLRRSPPFPPFEGRYVPPHRQTAGSQDVYGGFIRRVSLPVVPPDPFIIIPNRSCRPIPPIEPGTTQRRIPPHPEKIITIQRSRQTRIDESEAWGVRIRRTDIAPILYPDIRLVPARKCLAVEETPLFQGRSARRPIVKFGRPPEDIVIIWRRGVRFCHEVEEEHDGFNWFRPQPPSGVGPSRRPCPAPPALVAESETAPLRDGAAFDLPGVVEEQDSLPVMIDECY